MKTGACRPRTREAVARRWPRLTAHLIASSLGYACPSVAAAIILDASQGRPNWAEWILACYGGDPRPAVAHAIASRRCHRGYMADYRAARALVDRYNLDRAEPVFAAWF